MSSIETRLKDFIQNKSIVILGFGKEGQSTYRFIRSYFPQKQLCIADGNEAIGEHGMIKCDDNIILELGDDFLNNISEFDIVFKSPGISFKNFNIPENQIISSQTDLFLRFFSKQTIGVTGTKGKSTTVSLLHHVLSMLGKDVQLVGNIGKPVLDIIHLINNKTIVVYELSSHQLEFVNNSPHISILLNLYQEHLDHYNSYYDYRMAKWNISKYQIIDDYFIYCSDEEQLISDMSRQDILSNKLSYSFKEGSNIFYDNKLRYSKSSKKEFELSDFKMLGAHNVYNLMAVVLACDSLGINIEESLYAAFTFRGLPHRIEFVGEKKGIKFYNDSIATIPQATIRAIESVDDIDTLILGGFDRGIDYTILVDYLLAFRPLNLLLIGKVGDILYTSLKEANYNGELIKIEDFDSIIYKSLKYTAIGKSCLLSPAASSYDSFKNFEERGSKYKSLINEI
ncbi:MAG: UDP-N-acetylmuramoyl-L-alanine--D-glutamate ligase [Bacteroidales bacterium]|nr:UDP-N-acetylmuramoyl-L-alanine--D-glutamate ligase [Bacteroidales bacterium]